MKYCSQCSHPVTVKIPEGDDRLRHICDHCGTIHYQNPKVITGCIPQWEDKVLLCRRAIEPRFGLWTLPAGFMENGESTEEGAARETWEEACAKVSITSLYTLCSIPHISQVYMLFIGQLSTPEFAAGIESLEVELFSEAEIPWNELAFPVVTKTLKRYFLDQKNNHFPLYVDSLLPITPKV